MMTIPIHINPEPAVSLKRPRRYSSSTSEEVQQDFKDSEESSKELNLSMRKIKKLKKLKKSKRLKS